LLLRVAAGDRRALETLYLAYHRRLARFLSRFTRRYESVEEVINDTFLAVWQNAAEFRQASQVSTWIFGIAYRTALNSVRRQRHHWAAVTLDNRPEPSADPTQEAEMRDWVAHALDRLPLEQRMSLELAYHLGYSMEEIAATTGEPVGTIKARLFHAREKLRIYLPILGGTSNAG
jgi:RNA polymerase sigma-70 factor (ECF subfamily)